MPNMKKEQDPSQEEKDLSTEDTQILKDPEEKEAVIEETQEVIQEEAPSKDKEGFASWIKKHRKKVIAAGLALVLLGGALAVGGMHAFARHGDKEKRRDHKNDMHHEQSFDHPKEARSFKGQARDGQSGATPGEMPRVSQGNFPGMLQEREAVHRLLGEEELKKIVEGELKLASNEGNYRKILLLRNPSFFKDPRVATESEQTTPSTEDAKSKVLESASEPLLYEVHVEVKDKTHELLIGAVTGKVYSSGEQLKDQ